MKTKVLIGWFAAMILCEGVAHAQAQASPPQRAAAKLEPAPAVNAAPAPPPALQAPPKAVRKIAKATATPPAAKAPGDDVGPYGSDEAEGDDGANGAKPTDAAKPTAATKPVTGAPLAATAAPAVSPATVAGTSTPVTVDGSLIMSMMGSNMNQTMRRGMTVQVTKLPKGISIAYVSDDPKIVERLQQLADGMRLIRDAWSE